MTFPTLILDSLYAGLLLIALGWVSDRLQARHRRHANRPRSIGPLADLDGWNRRPHGDPHFTAAREWSR